MSVVLWTAGFDCVTGFNLFDVFVDTSGLTSNTVRYRKSMFWSQFYDRELQRQRL
jgi:hypothetical protein